MNPTKYLFDWLRELKKFFTQQMQSENAEYQRWIYMSLVSLPLPTKVKNVCFKSVKKVYDVLIRIALTA